MTEYRIWVNMQGGYYTTIEASSKDEALDIAIEEADAFSIIDWDIDVEAEED